MWRRPLVHLRVGADGRTRAVMMFVRFFKTLFTLLDALSARARAAHPGF